MKLSWERQTLSFVHPWKIASSGAATTRSTWVVTIEEDGIAGHGEIAPASTFGQSIESAEAALRRVAPVLESSGPPWMIEQHLERLVPLLEGESATLCGLDAALHDWWGKMLGEPVHRLLGIDSDAMPPTSFTIGIDTPEITAQKTREAAAAGWHVLKVKLDERPVGGILDPVVSAFDGPLRVDANTSWTPEIAFERLEELGAYPVELVEQPYPPQRNEAVAELRDRCGVPIVADESFRHVGDLPEILGRFDGVNIKLSKCGGIRQALTSIHAARRHGLKIMLGCMTQSSLGISAAAQVAPLVDYVDLDGHLLVRDDPWEGLGLDDGRIVLSPDAGLGVRRGTG